MLLPEGTIDLGTSEILFSCLCDFEEYIIGVNRQNIHHTGEVSEYSIMQESYPSAQDPEKDSPFIPVHECRVFWLEV